MPGLSSLGVGLWMLGEPIERVLIDNEETTTTYTATALPGLLLGEVSLPTPKNHANPAILHGLSVETKKDGAATGKIQINGYDGSVEETMNEVQITTSNYQWTGLATLIGAYLFADSTTSRKSNTNLKVRIRLVGDSGLPNNAVYCRNCVLTVVPLYKVN